MCRHRRITVLTGILLLGLAAGGASSRAEPPPDGRPAACAALAQALTEHDRAISQELGQVRRELAELRQNQDRPGVREIAAGIGYIAGLFGVAAFMAARRERAGRGD